jgi:predicted RNA polymerase sigma factor
MAWIDAALTAARPQALGALLRYFGDLDSAEEAFQEACLRALQPPGSSSSDEMPPSTACDGAQSNKVCRATR